jgi:hypothetical protein
MSRVSEATGAGEVRRRVRGRPPSARRIVVETTVVCLVTGLLAGVSWWLLAPRFTVEVGAGELQPAGPFGESRFGADALFAIICALVGVLIALVLFTRHRHHPVLTACALVAAGVAGSIVAWRLGLLLGAGQGAEALDDMADGTRLELPLGLGATGVLFGWPVASVITVIAISLFGNDQNLGRPAGEAEVNRAGRSAPWSLP